MTALFRGLRSIVAVAAGYAVMVVLITLAQEVLLGGVSYGTSSLFALAGAGVMSFGAAIAGGTTAAVLCGGRRLVHAIAMSVLVIAETSALMATGRLSGPLWFDLAASGSLIAGILFGGLLIEWATSGPGEAVEG